MRSNGVRTRAIIISVWETREHKASQYGGIYKAEISFENESGITVRGCCTSRGTYLKKFQHGVGEEFDIIYYKNNHNEFYLPSDKQELYWSVFSLIVGIIVMSISIAFVWVMFKGVLLK